jgi:hypothetical protein
LNWRRHLPWIVWVAGFAAAGLLWHAWNGRMNPAVVPAAMTKPAVERPAAPVDLAKHDGALIDFSTGRAVINDSPAEKAATEKAVAEMDAAAKEVTFEPTKTGRAEKPAADAGKK